VKRTSFIAAAFVLAATGARAQETLPPLAQPAAPSAARANAAAPNLQRIYHIRQIEGMLTNAVKAGAASLANQLKISEPNSLFVTGNARTRGFEIEGYGVFFDVDVPTMMQSVLWVTQTQQQQQYMDFLRRQLADPTIDDSRRRMAEFELRRVSRAMNSGQVAPIPIPSAPPTQAAPQGLAVAQTTEGTPTASNTPPAASPEPRSPDELYTETIKGALIDAMLSYGNALQLRDEEWLTIAARASNQGTPGQLDDSSSIVIRVKGSDLSAFLKGNLSRDEVIKKIEIKEG
jgi:hypothetical protein